MKMLKKLVPLMAMLVGGAMMAADLPPADYQLLEYIECTGEQYIDSGIYLTSNSTVTVDFTPLDVTKGKGLAVFNGGLGAMSDYSTQMGELLYINGNGFWAVAAYSHVNSGNDSKGLNSPLMQEMPEVGKRVVIEIDSWQDTVRFNGNRNLRLAYPRNGQTPAPLVLFHNTTYMKGRLHSCRIASSGVSQSRLVPCRRTADGVLGVYDLVREQFIMNGNANAETDFTAGPDSADLTFEIDTIAEQAGDGVSPVVPAVTVRTVQCGRVLASGTDYSLAFADNTAAGTATVTATGLGAFAGLSATRTFKLHRDGGAFRLATWNVGHWSKGASANSNINWDPNGIPSAANFRAQLDNLDADWFGVCEFSQMFCVGNWADAVDCVFQRYPHWVLGPQESYQWNSVFHSSRFQILESRIDYYPTHTQNTYALQHRVLVDGEYEAWFVQTHLDWSSQAIRDTQIQWLIDTYADKPRVIISGDFNTAVQNANDAQSRTCVDDYELFAAAGYSIANSVLPTDGAIEIIDNVLAKGFRIGEVVVDNANGLSDHKVLSCTLEPLAPGFIAKPSAPMAVVYDGNEHLPTITSNSAYTVSCGKQSHVGTYPVTVSLCDKANTAWEDGTTADLEMSFTISKAANVWTTEPSISSTLWATNGTPAVASAGAAYFGTPVANYTSEQIAQLGPGDYTYTVSVAATDDYDGLEKSLSFSIYIPFLVSMKTEAGLTTGATLFFAPTDQARTLYVVYDDVDHGEDNSGWPGRVPLATVAAGEGTATVQLPRAAGRECGTLRFMLVDDYDSSSYVQNGLVAQWDARENAGRGVHDASASKWKDLVGSVDLSNSDWDYTSEDAVLLPNNKRCTAALSGLFAANSTKTVEVVCRTTEDFNTSNNSRMDIVNLCNDGAVTFRGGGGYYVVGIFVQNSNRSAKYFYNSSSADNTAARIRTLTSYSSVMAPTYADCTINVNDKLFATGKSSSFWTTTFNHNDNVIVGGDRAPVYISSIRLYNRALTDAERSANFKVDNARFLLGKAAGTTFSAVQQIEVPLNAELRYEDGKLLADVGFAPGGKVNRALYLAVGPRDFGDNREAWPMLTNLCVVAKNVNHVHDLDLSAFKNRSGFRFFLVDIYDSTSYVQSGLYAQWDAVENAGRGVHDATLTTGWKDLVGSHDLTAGGTVASLTVADDYIMIPQGGRLTATSTDFNRPTNRTMEVSCWVDSTFSIGSSSRCDMMHMCNDCAIAFRGSNATSYTGGVFVNDSNKAFYMRPCNTAVNNADFILSAQTYSLYYAGFPTDSRMHINGALAIGCGWNNGSNGYTKDKTAYSYATSTWAHTTNIGMAVIEDARGNLYYNAARIYKRQLTDEERIWNAQVDRCRFAGQALPVKVSNFIKNHPPLQIFIR